MKRKFFGIEGDTGHKNLWVTLDPLGDGTMRGQIHKETLIELHGYALLAQQGRLFTYKGALKVLVNEVTTEGRFTAATVKR